MDLIDRQAAIDAVKTYLGDYEISRTVQCRLRLLPSVQPERKKGHWKRHNTYYGDDVSGSIDPDWRCSECGGQANVNEWFMYDLTDFCPHCGAAMTEEGAQNG